MIHVEVKLKGRVLASSEHPGPRVLIGRARTSDLVLDSAAVEPVHCALERRPDRTWRLTVLSALGDTRVNGLRVRGEVEVGEDDVLGVARFVLSFRWTEALAARAPARIGRYEVTGELGRGGMGLVLRARDPRLGRDVAIKVLKQGRDASEQARRRFEREASLLGRLLHPNILDVFDVGDHEGEPYLVMELVEGESLEERLLRDGPLAVPEAARITEAVARALHHAHAQQVLHRDVKPGNILIRARSGDPLLTDFGLAKELAIDWSGLTALGTMLGTAGFCPLEQMQDAASATAQSDVFAVGATLYAVLCGRPPFFGATAPTTYTLLEALRANAWTPLAQVRPGVPPGVDVVLGACLRAAPAERYPDALALAEDLARLRRGEAPRGLRPPGPAPRRGDIWIPLDEPAPVPDPASEADACVERARERFLAGDALAAVAALDRALDLAPGRADLWSMRAVARRRRGDHRGALADQDEALRLDPDDIGARVGRGLIRARARDHLRAAEDFEHALDCLPPDSPRRARLEAMLERSLATLGDTVVRGFRLRRPSSMGEVDPPKPR